MLPRPRPPLGIAATAAHFMKVVISVRSIEPDGSRVVGSDAADTQPAAEELTRVHAAQANATPQSTGSVTPVTYFAASDTSQSTASVTSLGWIICVGKARVTGVRTVAFCSM